MVEENNFSNIVLFQSTRKDSFVGGTMMNKICTNSANADEEDENPNDES